MNKTFCDVCKKECIPTDISIEIERTGIVGSELNKKQTIEAMSFQVCNKCDTKIKLKREGNSLYFSDLIIDHLRGKK